MNRLRSTILIASGLLFLAWATVNFNTIAGDRDGFIRLVLGLVLSLSILFRWKPRKEYKSLPVSLIPLAAIVGTVMVLAGIIFEVHQFEWLGFILVLFASLCWAMPVRYSRDIMLAMFLFYWVHQLPGQIFAPFQLMMQALSVKGSEWLLHCVNIKVWADGLILRTGFHDFCIPEACSGMRTSVTVLICTLGVGILFRFKWYQNLCFLIIGIAQVLVLNILRIAFMVLWAPRMSSVWADTFLHDTLGIFLLVSILLVQVEASWWKIRGVKKAQNVVGLAKGDIEVPDRATILPRFWSLFIRWFWWGSLVTLFICAVFFAIYKKLPSHRLAMMKGVIKGLTVSNPEVAEKAVDQALAIDPESRELLTQKVRILIASHKFAEAIKFIDSLSMPLSTEETVMKSWALMSLHKSDQAMVIIDSLPDSAKNLPGVAVIKAEYAVLQDQPDIVSKYTVIASRWHVTANRVRTMFPYMASREQWQAITECDNKHVPFKDSLSAGLTVKAYIKVNNIAGAIDAMRRVQKLCPHDKALLDSLFKLALIRPNGEWSDLFAESLRFNIKKYSTDELASYMSYSFQLQRPDLAWLAYVRLRTLDPSDPSLYEAPARYGNVWFLFRRNNLMVESSTKSDFINLQQLYLETRNLQPFSLFWAEIPLADEFLKGNAREVRHMFVKKCLGELAKRKAKDQLTERMYVLYPPMLAMDNRYDDAHKMLDEIEQRFPDMKRDALLQHAVFYDRQRMWQKAYEALMNYSSFAGNNQSLMARLVFINVLMNLNQGLYAMEIAREARSEFPEAQEVDMAVAAIWRVFNFTNQALFVLDKAGILEKYPFSPQWLQKTGQFKEAERISRALGIVIPKHVPGSDKYTGILPAETSVIKQWSKPLSTAETDKAVNEIAKLAANSSSPFFKNLYNLEVSWFKGHGADNLSDLTAWSSIGRNSMEKAASLYSLGMLLARQKKYDLAKKVIEQVKEYMPDSAMVRRVLIDLSNADRKVVEDAFNSCPNDPEIWLARLVVRIKNKENTNTILNDIENAAQKNIYSAYTMVRAGDLLLRKGYKEAACVAAKNAIKRSRGYLQAYILGLRCALMTGDSDWAYQCARGGIENSDDPSPFYRAIVFIKSRTGDSDADMIKALEFLHEHFDQESTWSEMLGFEYFEKGNAKRALNVMIPAIDKDFGGVRVQSLLLVAEAARLAGDLGKDINILESTYALYPDHVHVLNNLVYSLSLDNNKISQARKLLPKLLEKGRNSAIILDTIAMVYFRSGDIDSAWKYMEKALALIDGKNYAFPEIELNAGKILFALNRDEDAMECLNKVRSTTQLTPFVDRQSRDLIMKIKKELNH